MFSILIDLTKRVMGFIEVGWRRGSGSDTSNTNGKTLYFAVFSVWPSLERLGEFYRVMDERKVGL